MNNNIQQFLEERYKRLSAGEVLDTRESDRTLVNFILGEVEREVNKPEVASGVMLDQRGRKWVDLQDLSVVLNNLRVK